eukprot:118714_1
MNNAMNNPLMMPMNQNIMSKKWPCKACTFSNHGWTDRCEVCSAERCVNNNTNNNSPIGSPIYNSVPKNKFVFDANVNEQMQPWCCPICTLLNGATNARCDACNATPNTIMNMSMGSSMNDSKNNDYEGIMNMSMGPSMNDSKNNDYEGIMNMSMGPSMNDSKNNDYEGMMNMSMGPSMNDSKNNDHFEPTVEDFSRVASDIACFNDNPN